MTNTTSSNDTIDSIQNSNPTDTTTMVPSTATDSPVSLRSPEEVLDLMAKHQGLVRKSTERALRAWAPENDADAVEEWRKELVQIGQKGLRLGAEKFDPARGTQFSTCAMPWIAKYIRDAAEDLHTTCMHASLDMPVGDADDASATLGDLMADDDAEDPSELVARASDCEWARELLGTLPPRERSIVARHLGLDGRPAQTLTQIAREDGVSTQCTDRIYQRALQRLRKALCHPDLDPAA